MKLYTIQEYAKEMGVSVITVRRWIKNGEVNHIKKGRTIRIPQDELQVKKAVEQHGI